MFVVGKEGSDARESYKTSFLLLVYSERMSIHARIIILYFSFVLHECVTKNSEVTFIRCHNVILEFCGMVVTTSVNTPSWHENVCECALTLLYYIHLHKLILTLSFSYLWLWNPSILTPYHLLSPDNVRV